MSYTEHDETMDSRSLDGITASGAAESSPVGVSQRPVWRGQIPPETGQKA